MCSRKRIFYNVRKYYVIAFSSSGVNIGVFSRTMRFNHRELALYASNRLGRADKEGCLWMKEYEGILRKKESELQTVLVVFFGSFIPSTVVSFPSIHAEMVSTDREPAVLL